MFSGVVPCSPVYATEPMNLWWHSREQGCRKWSDGDGCLPLMSSHASRTHPSHSNAVARIRIWARSLKEYYIFRDTSGRRSASLYTRLFTLLRCTEECLGLRALLHAPRRLLSWLLRSFVGRIIRGGQHRAHAQLAFPQG